METNRVELSGGIHTEYLKILSEQGRIGIAGDQRWWRGSAKSQKPLNYPDFCRDESYRIWQMGCGVIAMIDAECYMMHGPADGMTRDAYMELVSEKMHRTYHLPGDPLHYLAGLFPWTMTGGLKKFFQETGHPERRARWAPFLGKGKGQGEAVLEAMAEMLERNLPVVFSYHTFRKEDPLILYSSPEQARGGEADGSLGHGSLSDVAREQKRTGEAGAAECVGRGPEQALAGRGAAERVLSHYMTVIGMEWAGEDKRTKRNVVLKIVSWGRIYYISYDVYRRHLSPFTNILWIS